MSAWGRFFRVPSLSGPGKPAGSAPPEKDGVNFFEQEAAGRPGGVHHPAVRYPRAPPRQASTQRISRTIDSTTVGVFNSSGNTSKV